MKRITCLLYILFSLISFASCTQNATPADSIPSAAEVYSFHATVLEVNNTLLLVQPHEDSNERKSSDRISLSFEGKSELIPAVGDTVKIFYDGMIAESYPAQILQVYRIEIVSSANLEEEDPVSDPDAEKNSKTSSPVYWNLDRLLYTDPETGLSVRTPDENGHYTFRFASEGKLIELQTTDKQVVNYLDTTDAVGLVLDAEGMIIDALNIREIAIEKVDNHIIRKIDGNTISTNISLAVSSMDLVLTIPDTACIMDVRPNSETPGHPIALEPFDTINVYCDMEGVITAVFLRERIDTVTGIEKTNFSYEEDMSNFVPGSPGVVTDNFVNTTEMEIRSENVINRAHKECTVTWDRVAVSHDSSADVWRVIFYTEGMLGGDQTVYLSNKGMTLLIVYGE